jgi:TP901 family phage tail tape measure protein
MKPEKTTVTVDFDGRAAGQQLISLSKDAAKAQIAIKKAYEANDADAVAKNERELAKLQSRMKTLRKEAVDVNGTLSNLSGATLPELTKAEKKLQSMLGSNKIKRNSKEWKEVSGKLQLVSAEKKKVRAEMRGMNSQLTSSNNKISGLGKNLALWVGGLGLVAKATQLVTSNVRKSVEAYESYEDKAANLSALTKLQGDELKYLKQKAKETSVATLENGIIVKQSATDILDAYTMIGSQKPELLKSKEALHEVTKEAIILSEAAKMQLEPASKALTNSLNQFNATADQSRRYINVLAAGSQAGAGNIKYLSRAIEKSGTTAKMMNLEYEDLVALIETVAPKFSEASQAGNSLDKVMMKMKAKQIGYKDGVFDMNRALEELSVRFGKGEMASQIFGEEHAKMVEVLVQGKDEFNRYREAVTDTNVALEQAATNTNTQSAKRQQQKNELQLLRIELGEKLLPIVDTFTRSGIKLIKITSTLIDTASKYRFSIMALIVSYTAFSAAKKVSWLWSKRSIVTDTTHLILMNIKTAATRVQIAVTGKSTIAQKRLLIATKATNTAMKSTPWGLIASLAIAAGVAIYEYTKNSNKLSESQQRLKDIEKQHNDELGKQTGLMQALFAQLKKTNPGTEARVKLVDKLAGLFPNLVDKQKLYASGLKDLEKAEKSYGTALEDRIRLQVQEDKFAEIVKQQMAKEKEILEKEVELIDKQRQIKELKKKGGFWDGFKAADLRNDLVQTGVEVQKLKADLQDLDEQKSNIQFNSKVESPEASGTEPPSLTPPTSSNIALTDEEKKALKKRIKAEKKAAEVIKKYREDVIRNSLSAVEKENSAFNDRLKKAGLFGKKKKKLTTQDKKVLEVLETEHQAKLDKIDSDAISKYLSKKKDTQACEMQDLHLKHAEELAAFDGNNEEKKALQKRQQSEEKQLLTKHLTELIALGQKLFNDGALDGLSLSDSILSDEEKKKIEEKLKELKEKRAELFGEEDKEKKDKSALSEVDILGMTPDKWTKFQDNLAAGKLGLEELQIAVKLLTSTFSMYDKIQSAAENRSLKKYQKNTDKKKKALEGQLKSGKITQEKYNSSIEALDHQLDAKKAEIEQKQAKRQKAIAIVDTIINTAVGISAALKIAPPLGFILAGITAGMGAAQLAVIASQPLPGKERGGRLVTRDDGKQYNAVDDPDKRGYINRPTVIVGESGEEFVMNNDAVQNPTLRPLIDTIDMAQRNGTVASLNLPAVLSSQNSIKGREQGGSITNHETSDTNIDFTPGEQSEEIIDAINLLIKVVKDKKLELPWYGRGGLDERMKQAMKIEKKSKY